MSSVTITSSTVTIYKPDQTALAGYGGVGTGGAFIDAQTLPSTGTYTILIDPATTYTGSMTLTLYDVPPDITGTITPGGSSFTVTTTTPGQNGNPTFAGTTGQKISLWVSNTTVTNCVVSIKKPDGSTLSSINLWSGARFIDAQTLPSTGTYTVLVDPLGTSTGSVTLILYDVVDVTGTISIGGSSVNVTITSPGQNGQLTFSGTSGQLVTVRVSGNTILGVTVKVLKPDGSQLTSSTSSSSSFNLTQQTLPTTGTYTIVIDPSLTNTGSLNVSVTSP